MKRRLLDLFCGAGGAGMGYARAGFEVVGVDNRPQPHYPFTFIQADALEYVAAHGREFDAIHASPPCQKFTIIRRNIWPGREHPDLIEPVRELLEAAGNPYAIENVHGAPLHNSLMLCGTMFGLRILRHRYFETNPPIYFAPAPCAHVFRATWHGRPPKANEYVGVTGHFSGVTEVQRVMEIDWTGQAGLAQAIPPAYTEYIGRYLMEAL